MDETGLYIKNIGNRTYTMERNDNKNVKINKTKQE